MKTNRLFGIIAGAGLLAGCATTAPGELVGAREAYRRASTGSAATVAPADLHVAKQALDRAEQSFKKDAKSYQTKDLAYVAQRRSEIAEARASIIAEQKTQVRAKADYEATQGTLAAESEKSLSEARQALAASERAGEARLATERDARAAAEQQTAASKAALEQQLAASQAALAKLAAVKEEPRGMVITLSGSVLFASNRATLLPESRRRLDQVVEVLLTTRERTLIVEGHTDSRGSEAKNL